MTADAVFQTQNQIDVTSPVQIALLTVFVAIGLFEVTPGAFGDAFDQQFAMIPAFLLAGVHQFENEGLQKKDRRQIGKFVFAHVGRKVNFDFTN